MNKFAKTATALACAALVAAGGLVQASAAGISVPYNTARMTGTATRVSSTEVSATTMFRKNSEKMMDATATVRAYAKVNGNKQYGAKEPGYDMSAAKAIATATVYAAGGVGTTGYGGEHFASFKVESSSGYATATLSGTSSY